MLKSHINRTPSSPKNVNRNEIPAPSRQMENRQGRNEVPSIDFMNINSAGFKRGAFCRSHRLGIIIMIMRHAD